MFNKTASCLVLSLINLLAWGIPSANALDIGVTPPRFELDINNKKSNRSNSIQITNLSDKAVEMRAYVRNWTIDENNEVQDAASTEESLDRWIVFTPSRFTVPPRGTQTVRFALRPKQKPAAGEYRAVIYLEEVSSEKPNSEVIDTVGRIGVAVYAFTADVKRIGNVNSVTVDTKSNTIKAIFDVSNKGNAHLRINGQYAIWRAGNYPGAKATQMIRGAGNPNAKLPANVVHAGTIESLPILPSHRRKISLPLIKQLPPGNYVLDVNANLGGTAVDTGIPFSIPVNNANEASPKPASSSTK